jgi:hypothetical protein
MSTSHALPVGRFALAAFLAGALVLLVSPERSPAQGAAGATAPSVVTTPSITGSATKGSTLTATSGSWAGTSPISFEFRWLRCDNGGDNCITISGATEQTYVLVSGDVGKRIRIRVTATNADGTATVLSDPTAVVQDSSKPGNTKEPTISGSPVEGQKLTATTGTWSGATPITYAFQWVRCGTNGGKPDGSDCSSVGGATSSTHTLGSGDVGKRMRVRVTATNSAGSNTAASNPTATVAAKSAGKPANTAEPTISGTPAVGQLLTASNGAWTGDQPISYSYRWVRCGSDGGRPDGSNCGSISGATSSTYTLRDSDLGRRLRVKVTARNARGSATAASNPTSTVGPAGPAGVITLPNGERSIPVTSVPADQRLIVDAVVFSPNPVRTRTAPIVVRIRVKDTRGYVVRDARVFVRSTPLVTSSGDGRATATDGWVAYELVPRSTFPEIRDGFNVQFFVKAYRSGDPVLGGVAGTRLVQVALAR